VILSPSITLAASSVNEQSNQTLSTSMSVTTVELKLSPSSQFSSASVISSGVDIQPSPSVSLTTSITESTMNSASSVSVGASHSVVVSASDSITPSLSQTLGTSSAPSVTSSSAANAPTTPASIPTSGTIIYAVGITIEENFTNDLENRDSQAFKTLETRFIDFLKLFYQDLPGFIKIVVNSFKSGSIVANIDVIFNSTVATTTVEQIKEPIVQAKNSNTAPFVIQDVDVVEKGVHEDDDGLETWLIVLIVCLCVAFVILVVVSLVVSTVY
jgi:hypothetical protein